MNIKLAKHTMTNSVFLHFFPGVIIILIYIMIVPIVTKNGFPNDTAMYITDIIGLVPVELGILLYVTKKKTGTYNIKTLFPYLEKAAVKEYVVFALIMAAWALLVSALMEPLELMIQDNIFSFVPTEYIMGSYDITTFSEDKLLLTGLLGIIANGFIAPIFEELYFRGYLLPRINLSPIKAAVVSAVLFSVYHFYSPWYFTSRVLMMIPLYYWVEKKKNIRFSILAHIISNVVTSVSFLLSIM